MKEHPTATKVVAGVALVAATGGTALALAPEAAAAGALATAGEETAAASSAIAENAGGHTVYQEVVGGVTKYVGQTGRTLSARAGEHPRETGRVIQPVVTGLRRSAARDGTSSYRFAWSFDRRRNFR